MDLTHGKETAPSESPQAQKRRRLDVVNSVPLTFSNRLNQIVQEISDRFEEARDMLVNQVVIDKQTITDLESSLKEARDFHQDSEMKRKIKELTDHAKEEESKRNTAEAMLTLRNLELEEAKVNIAELRLQRTSLCGEIRILLSKAKRVDELEAELKSLRATASQEKASTSKEGCDNMEGLRQPSTSMNVKCEELILNFEQDDPIDCRVAPVPSKDGNHHLIQNTDVVNARSDLSTKESGKLDEIPATEEQTAEEGILVEEKSPAEAIVETDSGDQAYNVNQMQQGGQEHRLAFSGYSISVSNPQKFFAIDWNTKIKRLGVHSYLCSTCRMGFITSEIAEDHIWSQHYGERFTCIHCISTITYTRRDTLKKHIQKQHPSVRRHGGPPDWESNDCLSKNRVVQYVD